MLLLMQVALQVGRDFPSIVNFIILALFIPPILKRAVTDSDACCSLVPSHSLHIPRLDIPRYQNAPR